MVSNDLALDGYLNSRAQGSGLASYVRTLASSFFVASPLPVAAAVPVSRKAEAEALRAIAWKYDASDRGFADDLYAAADRHEGIA